MKKIIAATLCAVLITVFISGCVSVNISTSMLLGSGVTGSGDRESYTFSVGEITEIKIELYCDIEYYAAPSDTVTLEIQPNLMEYVTVEESDGVLTVRSTRSLNITNRRAPILTVGAPSLSRLTITGAGTLTAHDTITADSFYFDVAGAVTGEANFDVGSIAVNMSGAGDLRLSGSADTARFSLAGAGNLDALELQTLKADVTLAGAGVVRVSCSDHLTVNAGGVGSVEYKGSPDIEISRGGLVSVSQIR